MKKHLLILSFFIVIVLFSGCKNDKHSLPKLLSTTLKLNWIWVGSYGGEVFGKSEFAKKYNLDLEILPGGQGLDPLKLVGKNEFGVAAADEILRAIDKGADFIIIGVINYYSPACFVSKKSANINTPKDLEGKTVGILPFGSTGLVYKFLLKKNHVDKTKITEMIVSPDLRVFIATENHQVQPAFIYDETVSLDMQGVEYNVLEPKEWGVNFKGMCYFCKDITLKTNPNLVRAFIYTMADGWNEAIKNPIKAIQALKVVAPNIDEERELKVLTKGKDYYNAYNGQPLYSDIESWIQMSNDLKSIGIIKNNIPINDVIDLSFVKDYYTNK